MAPAIRVSQETPQEVAARRAANATGRAAWAERRCENVQGDLSR